MLKFHNETARALRADGRERTALMRTWQRVGVLGSPTTLGKTDHENVLFSVKNTDGDFGCVKGFDEEFLEAVGDPTRLLVEFDAWREYETHNIFPIYLGDYWAPRFRRLAEIGVKRIGLRFNWNSGHFPITERPWANWVNVFTFVRLAENPYADPDAILREFVRLYFPPEAQQTAFDLYKSSFDYVKDLYWVGRERIADHGRVNRERKLGGKEVPADWLDRVDASLRGMLARIDALPQDGAYKEELRHGALVVSYLSRACALQIGAEGDAAFLAEWQRADPESFDELRGDQAVELLAARATREPRLPAESTADSPSADGDVYEAEKADVSGALITDEHTDGPDDYHEGATGGAYVDFQEDAGDAITWQVDISEEGTYRLSFRYALEDDDPRPLRLEVNGEALVESLPFTDTGDWESWRRVAAESELRAGRNAIRLEAIGESGPNIDHLSVERIDRSDGERSTGERSSARARAATFAPRTAKTIVRGGTTLEVYPVSPVFRGDGMVSGTANGAPIPFESFRTSSEYYYDVSYAWLAADGPLDVELRIRASIERAHLRTVLEDLAFEKSGSTPGTLPRAPTARATMETMR